MYKNTLIRILSDPNTYIKSVSADIQPFSKEVNYEDGFQLNITKRIFCDIDESITEDNYIVINGELHKILYVKPWDDFLEVHLYKCRGEV